MWRLLEGAGVLALIWLIVAVTIIINPVITGAAVHTKDTMAPHNQRTIQRPAKTKAAPQPQQYRIVMVTSPISTSHALHTLRAAHVLASQGGHNVTVVTFNFNLKQRHLPADSTVSIKNIDDPQLARLHREVSEREMRGMWSQNTTTLKTITVGIQALTEGENPFVAWYRHFVRIPLRDAGIMDWLVGFDPDLVITDPLGTMAWLGIAHYRLRVPTMFFDPSLLYAHNAGLFQSPNMLSYTPAPLSGLPSPMTFWQRLRNVNFYLMLQGLYLQNILVGESDRAMAELTGERWSAEELYQNVSMLMVTGDQSLDYVRATSPSILYVPCVYCHTEPAPDFIPDKKLESFLSSAASEQHGVILFSMGTLLRDTPEHLLRVFLTGLGRVPQSVVWYYPTPLPAGVTPLPANVMVMQWVPQMYILGHRNTRAFLSHGGLNGLMEAVYQGVPVVGIPVFGDQQDNMERVRSHGAGILLPKDQLTAEALMEAITEVVNNRSYSENMMKRRDILRDQPQSPADRLIYWVQYVIRHRGAPHLKSAAPAKLNWAQYLLLDVALFMLSLATLLVLSTCALCCCCCCSLRRTCGKRAAHKPKQKTN